MRHRPPAAFLALAAVSALGLTGCSAIADAGPGTGSLGGAPATPAPAFDAAPALAKLDTLAVKGRAPKTGYTREQFGPSWSDDNSVEGGHNGCDTRNDILRRDLVDLTYKTSTRDCVVATGTLHDTYTGTTIAFVRGQDTSTAVQIDHVVSVTSTIYPRISPGHSVIDMPMTPEPVVGKRGIEALPWPMGAV